MHGWVSGWVVLDGCMHGWMSVRSDSSVRVLSRIETEEGAPEPLHLTDGRTDWTHLLPQPLHARVEGVELLVELALPGLGLLRQGRLIPRDAQLLHQRQKGRAGKKGGCRVRRTSMHGGGWWCLHQSQNDRQEGGVQSGLIGLDG